MSYNASKWVWESSETQGVERLVLLALAFHCQKDGWSCWPSVERLAAFTQTSASTVRRSLKSLERKGDIRIKKQAAPDDRIAKNRRPNLYTVIPRDDIGVSSADSPNGAGVSDSDLRGVKSGGSGVSARDTQMVNEYMNPKEDQHSCPYCDDGYVWSASNTVERCKYA